MSHAPGFTLFVVMGAAGPTPVDGTYVVEYDPARPPRSEHDVPPGCETSEHCLLVLSCDERLAKRYATQRDAMLAWQLVHPGCRAGRRDPRDERPCRPLTAYSVAIEPASVLS